MFSNTFMVLAWKRRELDFIRIVFLPKNIPYQERDIGIELYVMKIIMIVHGIEAGMERVRTYKEEGKWKDG